jgi:Flp pilus assembly protein CpaB
MHSTSTHEARNGHQARGARPGSERPSPGRSPLTTAPLTSASAAKSSPVRRLRRWVTPRVVGGVVVMAGTFAGYLAWLLVSTPTTSDALVLTRDVPAGVALSRADLTAVPLQLPDAQARAAVPAAALDRVVGRRLVGPAFRDQVLVLAELATGPEAELEPGHEAVTVAVRPDTADGGALRRDDLVRVVMTTNKGRPEAQSRTVVGAARVVTIGRGDQRSQIAPSTAPVPGGDGAASIALQTGPRLAQPISTVTLSVASEQVEALTAAKWAGEIDLVLLPSSPQPTPEADR